MKLCLHLNYIVQNSFHFDEIFDRKFKIPILICMEISGIDPSLFQRLLLSITPEKEQKDIIEGKPGTRATLDHWISL